MKNSNYNERLTSLAGSVLLNVGLQIESHKDRHATSFQLHHWFSKLLIGSELQTGFGFSISKTGETPSPRQIAFVSVVPDKADTEVRPRMVLIDLYDADTPNEYVVAERLTYLVRLTQKTMPLPPGSLFIFWRLSLLVPCLPWTPRSNWKQSPYLTITKKKENSHG